MDAPRFLADGPLPTVEVEGFAVVYHPPSGATHLLGPPVPEILGVLTPAHGPATVADIVARLAARFDLDGDAAAVVAARLAELETAGLVRRA